MKRLYDKRIIYAAKMSVAPCWIRILSRTPILDQKEQSGRADGFAGSFEGIEEDEARDLTCEFSRLPSQVPCCSTTS